MHGAPRAEAAEGALTSPVPGQSRRELPPPAATRSGVDGVEAVHAVAHPSRGTPAPEASDGRSRPGQGRKRKRGTPPAAVSPMGGRAPAAALSAPPSSGAADGAPTNSAPLGPKAAPGPLTAVPPAGQGGDEGAHGTKVDAGASHSAQPEAVTAPHGAAPVAGSNRADQAASQGRAGPGCAAPSGPRVPDEVEVHGPGAPSILASGVVAGGGDGAQAADGQTGDVLPSCGLLVASGPPVCGAVLATQGGAGGGPATELAAGQPTAAGFVAPDEHPERRAGQGATPDAATQAVACEEGGRAQCEPEALHGVLPGSGLAPAPRGAHSPSDGASGELAEGACTAAEACRILDLAPEALDRAVADFGDQLRVSTQDGAPRIPAASLGALSAVVRWRAEGVAGDVIRARTALLLRSRPLAALMGDDGPVPAVQAEREAAAALEVGSPAPAGHPRPLGAVPDVGTELLAQVGRLHDTLARTGERWAEDRDRLLTALMRTQQELQSLRVEVAPHARRNRRRGLWSKLWG